MTLSKNSCDVVVFSHLRWDLVFQRPQHLLTRCARQRRVYFIEEPVFVDHILPTLHVTTRGDRLHVDQDDQDVRAWCMEFGCNAQQLREAVKAGKLSAFRKPPIRIRRRPYRPRS